MSYLREIENAFMARLSVDRAVAKRMRKNQHRLYIVARGGFRYFDRV